MASSREDAENLLAEKIMESRQPISNRDNWQITVRLYAERWLPSTKQDLAQRTYRSYAQLFEKHILPAVGGMTVRDLRSRDVKRLLAEKRQTGLGRNSVRLIKAALSTLLSQAVEDAMIQANPALGRFREARKVGQGNLPDVNPMSHEQLAQLRQTVEQMHREGVLDYGLMVLLWMMPGTGLRPSEALALQTGDLDLRGKRLRIERALDFDGTVQRTKSEETRSVDLSEKLVSQLNAYVLWLEAKTIAQRAEESSWLFPGDPDHPLQDRHIRKVFRRVLNKADLPYFRVYDLRHTYASLLLSEGVPLLYVSKQLGHAKPTTTLRHYAKWIPSEDRRYADLLDRESGKSWHQITKW